MAERSRKALLLLILLAGGALRLWTIGLGNHSLTFQPDEDSNVPLALALSWTSLNPHAFYYPALHWYMLFGLDQLVFWVGNQYGVFRDWKAFGQLFESNPLPFFLLGRTLSTAFGTATLGLVYLIGRRLFSPAHGLLAAALLAATFLHVRDSALATPDAALAFFVALSLLGAVRVLQRGQTRDYIWAGLAGGLATATKYNGALVLLALVVAHGIRAVRSDQARHHIVPAPRLLGALLLATLVFVAVNPFFLLDWPGAREGLLWQWAYSRTGQYLDIGPGWQYHFTVSLRYGMGLALLALATAGLLRALWRREGEWLVLLSFTVAFFLEMGSLRAIFVRYMTPLLPTLALCAAAGVVGITNLVKWRGARPWIVAGLGLLAVAEPLHASVAYIRLVHHADTRVLAYTFIRDVLPPGTKVATYGPSVTWRSTVPRFLPTMYAKHPEETWADALGKLEAEGIHYFLAHYSELEVFSPTIPDLEHALGRTGTLIREFSPYADGARPHPVYDPVDAHFFPLGGFGGVTRPGPLVRLYRLG